MKTSDRQPLSFLSVEALKEMEKFSPPTQMEQRMVRWGFKNPRKFIENYSGSKASSYALAVHQHFEQWELENNLYYLMGLVVASQSIKDNHPNQYEEFLSRLPTE